MKFKNTLITTIMGSTMLAGSITGFVSCHQQTKNNLSNEISTIPSNDDKSHNIGFDENILKNTNLNKPLYKTIDANEYKQLMNIDDFNENFTFNNISLIEEGLLTDISNFVYNIYLSSKKKLDILKVKDFFTYKYDKENNTITFEVNFNIANKTNNIKYFSLFGNNYFIPENQSGNFNIKVNNQKVNFYFIESNSSNKELGWKVDNAQINFLGKKNIINNFSLASPNIGLYSLPYLINGITNKNNYLDAEKEWNNYILSQEEYKIYLEKYLMDTTSMSIGLIGSSSNLLTSIATNPSLKDFLSDNGGSELINLLVYANVIDKNISNFLKDLINPKTPLTIAIQNNVDAITSFVMKNFDSDLVSEELLKDILSIITPNMTESQKQQIDSLLAIIPENLSFIKDIVNLVFENKTSYEVLEYIIDNHTQDIIVNVGNAINNKDLVNDIFNLLKVLLTKNESEAYQGILDVVVNQKILIKSLINIAFNLFGMGNSFGSLFDDLYINNDKITVVNIQNALNTSIIPLTKFLGTPTNYKIENSYIKNLILDGNKISYEYQIKFVFLNSFKFDLKSICALLPNSINYNNIPIPVSLVLTYLPEWIEFGVDDSISVTFSSNNEVYKTPFKNTNGTYTMGFTIPQNVKFEMNLPKAIQSITGQYTYQIAWVNTLPWDFITSFLKTLVLKDYEFFDTVKISNPKYIINNYEEDQYIFNYHASYKDITVEEINNLFNYVDAGTNKGKTYHVKSKPGIWKFDGNITGDKPTISLENYQTILDSVLTFSDSILSLPENLKPVVSIVPVINGNIKAFGAIASAELVLKTIKISVYFPFKILDTTNYDKTNKVGEVKLSNLFTKELQFTK